MIIFPYKIYNTPEEEEMFGKPINMGVTENINLFIENKLRRGWVIGEYDQYTISLENKDRNLTCVISISDYELWKRVV